MTARAVGLTGSKSLSGVLREALEKETNLFAAREQMRAVAALDEADDGAILRAAERLGGEMWQVVGDIVVLRGGVRGLKEHLARFYKVLEGTDLQPLFSGALERPTESLDSLVSHVLDSENDRAWHDLLSVIDTKWTSVDAGIFLRGLAHSSLRISGETAWHLLGKIDVKTAAGREPWVAALTATEYVADGAPDAVDMVFGRELLGRVLGCEANTKQAWVESLPDKPLSHIDQDGMDVTIAPYLAISEIDAARKRYERLFEFYKFAESTYLVAKQVDPRIVRTVSAIPVGFVKDLMRVTHCKSHGRTNNVIQAMVTYDMLGRPEKVVLLNEPLSPECRDFATALFGMSLTPPGHFPAPGRPEHLVLFLEKSLLDSLEENQFSHWSTTRGAATPPKRTRFVPPAYPAGNIQQRVEGKVILEIVVGPEGRVKNMRLLHVKQDTFILSAMRAVLNWEYKPASLDGRPVAVDMVVIVEFSLR